MRQVSRHVRQGLVAATLIATITQATLTEPAHGATAASVDRRISVTTQGSGPDVVLIPGLASSAQVWAPTVAQLAPHYRVHVVQVLGFGGTPAQANATGPVIAPVTEAIDAYIAANHLAPVAMIGHSMGGLIGLQLAIEHPGDVRRLMVVDALPFIGPIFGADSVAAIAPRAQAMRDAMLAKSQQAHAARAPATIARMVRRTGPETTAATEAAARSDHRVVAQAFYDDMITDLRGRLGAIRQSVTVLYACDAASGQDAAATDRLYHAQYAALSGVVLHRIDDSRHFIMIDQPGIFADAVSRFLAAPDQQP